MCLYYYIKEIMLKIKNIYKSYKDKQLLKGVNLNVSNNEIKGLIGVNGAGKSTLIELICGIKKYNNGEIFVNNINVKDKKQKKILQHAFGYMPQTFTLFNDLTVKENLNYVASVYKLNKQSVKQVLEKCNLFSHKNTLAQNLSGGYRQLLSLAGAIIHSPKLLILDEPTSAMDPLFRKMFWEIIKDYQRNGGTILIITHYMEELNQCDSFACLANGKICYDGKVSDFSSNGILDIDEILKKYN